MWVFRCRTHLISPPLPFCHRIDPSYLKAYYRRASANYAIGKLKEALKDFKLVVKLKPKDEDAMKKMKTCEKEMRAEAFTKAIESEGGPTTSPVMSQTEVESIVVESTYAGPMLRIRRSDSNSSSELGLALDLERGSNPITNEFVHELIACFKNEKLLHKKYVRGPCDPMRILFRLTPNL